MTTAHHPDAAPHLHGLDDPIRCDDLTPEERAALNRDWKLLDRALYIVVAASFVVAIVSAFGSLLP